MKASKRQADVSDEIRTEQVKNVCNTRLTLNQTVLFDDLNEGGKKKVKNITKVLSQSNRNPVRGMNGVPTEHTRT